LRVAAQGAALKTLNLTQATVNKEAKQGQSLSRDESERAIGLARPGGAAGSDRSGVRQLARFRRDSLDVAMT